MKKTIEWGNQFAYLNGLDQFDAIKVLSRFGDCYDVHDARERFFNLFAAAMGSSNLQHDDATTKSNWMFYFENIMKLIEATHMIREMVEASYLVYSYDIK